MRRSLCATNASSEKLMRTGRGGCAGSTACAADEVDGREPLSASSSDGGSVVDEVLGRGSAEVVGLSEQW